jgi:hypothetical protein
MDDRGSTRWMDVHGVAPREPLFVPQADGMSEADIDRARFNAYADMIERVILGQYGGLSDRMLAAMLDGYDAEEAHEALGRVAFPPVVFAQQPLPPSAYEQWASLASRFGKRTVVGSFTTQGPMDGVELGTELRVDGLAAVVVGIDVDGTQWTYRVASR